MNLTGRQLVQLGIITGEIEEDNIQQCGIDLNVFSIEKVDGTNENGIIPVVGKTRLAMRIPQEKLSRTDCWYLMPGVYELTCKQGCRVPEDKMLLIRQRSSLARNGAMIHSSVFDPGFKTEHIGTIMIVHTPISIFDGARVAQIYAHNCNPVSKDKLYNGQFQDDSQRDHRLLD